MILAGDVGGTKTLVALFEEEDGRPKAVEQERYASVEYDGLGPIVERFLEETGTDGAGIGVGCFGVAGPVVRNHADPPNLPWDVDGDALGESTGVGRILLVNDVVAFGEGVPLLGRDQLHALQEGEPHAEGNRVLVAAGTGLGMATLPWVEGEMVAVASEGGHSDFAARDEVEIGLLRHLQGRHGRVSNERVVSGPGLHGIYEYLRETGYAPEDPEIRDRLESADDPARVIGETALDGGSALSGRALDLFVSIYGAVTGNLALIGMATGGVYLGGGIAPKILDKLDDGTFVDAFRAKGRYRDFMERIRVEVILEPETALLGAARRGLREADPERPESGR